MALGIETIVEGRPLLMDIEGKRFNLWQLIGEKLEDGVPKEGDERTLEIYTCPYDETPLIHRPDLGAVFPEVEKQFVWRCNDCMSLFVVYEDEPIDAGGEENGQG